MGRFSRFISNAGAAMAGASSATRPPSTEPESAPRDELRSPASAQELSPLISPTGRAALTRIGLETYGPPYPGPQPRIASPDGTDYFLHATRILGAIPLIGSPEWTDFENQFCPELLGAVESAGGGWAWAGALVVASDMHLSSRHPLYLQVLDRALAFLHESAVPAAHVPRFALDRWFETRGSEHFGVWPDQQVAEPEPGNGGAAAERPSDGYRDLHVLLRSMLERDSDTGGDPSAESEGDFESIESPEPPGNVAGGGPSDGSRKVQGAGNAAALELGDELLRQGNVDGAQTAYERAGAVGDVEAIVKLAALMEDHRKDLVAAEAAWRRADDAGHVNGSGNLGRLLRDKGDLRGAEAAFRRGADRGSLRAAVDYGGLLAQRRDATRADVAHAAALVCEAEDGHVLRGEGMLAGASFVIGTMFERCAPDAMEDGVRRADDLGSASGAYHLGIVLRDSGALREAADVSRRSGERGFAAAWMDVSVALLDLGDRAGAEAAAREGDKAGNGSASGMLGMLRDERGDSDGAFEAYRRADARGDGGGAFNLGIELRDRGDLRGAAAALERASKRGVARAEAVLHDVRRLMSR